MMIFLINLDRAKDRRDYMLSELSRLLPEMPVERALCIDIKSIDWTPPEWVTPGRWNSDRWSLMPSDIEIFRSHMDCWKKIAVSGEPGLVLEDDLIFSNDFGYAVRQLQENGIEGIVRLDAVQVSMILGKARRPAKHLSLSRTHSLTASSAAYIIDPITAASLAKNSSIERTVDDFLFDPTPQMRGSRGHGKPIWQLEPAVAIQAQFGGFTSPDRTIPDFLVATKRTDVKTRKDSKYVGPWQYRILKEIRRAITKSRQPRLLQEIEEQGGRRCVPDLHGDLRWK